jgi:hypothetical protein
MGYYTQFSLSVIPAQPNESSDLPVEVSVFIEANEDRFYAINTDGSCADDSKWYEHESAMCDLSKLFPAILFLLEGEGEENGDQWKEYYFNGKMKKLIKAVVTFEAVDTDALRDE